MKSDYEDLAKQLPGFEQSINSSRKIIASLFHLELLGCNGNPPNLAKLSEEELKSAAFFAAHDPVINVLPERHPLHYANLSGDPAMLVNMSRADIESKLIVMLQARNYKLSDEVIQFVISTKLNSIYNRASETLREVITKLEELSNSPPKAQELIAVYKEAAKPLLVNKERDVMNCYARCLEAFLNSLEGPPDISLQIDREGRFSRIVNILEWFNSLKELNYVQKAIETTLHNGHLTLAKELVAMHGCNAKIINIVISCKHFLLARELIDEHGYNTEQMRMLQAALKDILILGRVSKSGFLPRVPPEATVNIICFISESAINVLEATKLREEVICINTMAMQHKFTRRIEAPQESQELGM